MSFCYSIRAAACGGGGRSVQHLSVSVSLWLPVAVGGSLCYDCGGREEERGGEGEGEVCDDELGKRVSN